jgi:hypothetical protein
MAVLVAATAILPCSAGPALAALPRRHSNLRPLPAEVKAASAACKQRGRIIDAPSLDSGPTSGSVGVDGEQFA